MTHTFTTRNDVRTYVNNCQFASDETYDAAERVLWAHAQELNELVFDADQWHERVREILGIDSES